VTLETRASDAVTALEVRDASFGTNPVPSEPSASAWRARLHVIAGNEHVGGHLSHCKRGSVGSEAGVKGGLPEGQVEIDQRAYGLREQQVVVGRTGAQLGWQDQAPGSSPRVCGHLGQLDHVAELIGMAQLATSDRPRVDVEE